MNMNRGFTLLEVLVASLIMSIAVAGVLSALSTSLNNAGRLTEYDRAALVAGHKMDELLLDKKLPRFTPVEGTWELGGWRARMAPFEAPPGAGPGSLVLDRIELEVWWKSGTTRRSFTIEGFRRGVLTPPGSPVP